MLIGVPIAALAGPLPVAGDRRRVGARHGVDRALQHLLGDDAAARIPASVYARVRSYDILVSFVFMPLGFVVFPLIARALGVRVDAARGRGVAAATNLAVAFAPGVQRSRSTEQREPGHRASSASSPRAA